MKTPKAGKANMTEKKENQKTRVVKRYTNRKLYDTQESRYVTLDEIAAMIKSGEEVQIIDNRSGKDLTDVTMAQILYEEQKKQHSQMPLGLLKEIIRSRGGIVTDFIQRRVAQPVQSLKDEAEKKVDELVRRSESTMEETAKSVKDFFQNTQKAVDDIQKKLDDRIQSVVEVVGSPAKTRDQLKTLRGRIEELETRLKELQASAEAKDLENAGKSDSVSDTDSPR